LFHNVVDADLETLAGLRQLLVGGDVVSTDHAVRFKARFPDCRLINGYGPTENTSFTTAYEITGTETGPMPIGRPIANTTTYILDAHLRPVPIGVIGELWTGGDGLARGYLNDPELTAARFVTTTSVGLNDPVIYRTGDLARYRPDGVILFEGREDHQLKVNGFRVETEEVETLLLGHPDLAQVSVNPHRSPSGETQLAAHCVPRPGSEVTAASLRSFLQDRAPGYMVPSAFVMMDKLPLTHAGKVDRRALPEPRHGDAARPTERFEALDPLEATILSIWRRLFGADTIGVQDNFFDLGGHSLLAFRFFANLEQETGTLLPLATLFEAPTIERLARVVREGQRSRRSRLVPIKPDGSRPPIFFIHGIGGNVLRYGELARHLDVDQPAFGIDAVGLHDGQQPLTRMEDMARRNIEEIKTVQPEGPYVLAGGSFAGMVAFEMARQLADRGETVSLLALFDTFLVGPSVGTRLTSHARILATVPPQQKLEYLRERVVGRRKWAKRRHWQRMVDQGRAVDGPALAPEDEVRESNHLAVRRYVDDALAEHPYPGKVILFIASDRGTAQPHPVDQWDQFVSGELEKIVVPGSHGSILEEPNVRVLAQLLEERLQREAGDSSR
jgi:thioesterase domain-containing protein